MDNNLLELSRLQFAMTVAFHMTFPAITVGMSVFLAIVYGAYLRTRKVLYLTIYRFWLRIFAVGFALGVVTGVVMTFQFGLNWSGYSTAVGPTLAVMIGMEVITAFFLEAGFLGIMLYGHGRVSDRVMFFAICMVALGAILSTTWILSANSWMQTPAGYTFVNGQFRPTDWVAVIFNPSFGIRFWHMLLGVLLAPALIISGTGAWYLLKNQHQEFARRTLSMGLVAISILTPVQIWMGDTVAKVVAPFQPPKLEAMEGNWDSTNTGWNLLVIPDQARQRNLLQISIPCMGGVFDFDDWSCTKRVPGLSQTPTDLQPPMVFAFYGFRIMFFSACLMYFAAAASLLLRLRGELYEARWFHRLLVAAIPVGVVAVIAGWVVAETGRQPFVVYGLLRTSNAVSPIQPAVVAASLVLFLLIYGALLGIYVGYFIRVVRRGPQEVDTTASSPRTPGSPEAPGPGLPGAS
jgi:cytochrome bd ubiquinol oxidase subunit I